METNQILQASLLDIVFDGRNKSYGAYELRNRYDKRLIRAIGITSLLSLFVVLASFVAAGVDKPIKEKLDIKDVEIVSVDDPEKVPLEPPPPHRHLQRRPGWKWQSWLHQQ